MYYFYKLNNGVFELERTFKNFYELIRFLAFSQNGEKYIKDKKICYNNKYLDKLNLNFNDVFNFIDFNGDMYQIIRPYVFFDSNFKIIDIRYFYEDIIKEREQILKERKNYYQRKYQHITFRQDPIPYTGKYRGFSYRNVKYKRLIKDFKNPENKKYVRKKKYYDILEPYFDFPYQNISKSWKDQTKNRHQWEKNLKKGGF